MMAGARHRASYAERMRWNGLFDDLEAHWADLGWQETVAEAAELTLSLIHI